MEELEIFMSKYKCKNIFRKILITNNGLSALKFIYSLKDFSYKYFKKNIFRFYGMVTKEDLESNHKYIYALDEYKIVPSGTSNVNYSDLNLIVNIAKDFGVDCVYPGWGHASENHILPKLLGEASIAFLGPSSHAMWLLGDKLISNIICMELDIPTIPWCGAEKLKDKKIYYTEENMEYITEKKNIIKKIESSLNVDIEEIKKFVELNGFPIMFKTSNSGGGKGIRVAKGNEELEEMYETALKEVGDGVVIATKLLKNVRHIEIQVFGDIRGKIMVLGGRDCTIQRRHQKLIEESPPTILDRNTYKMMKKDSIRLIKTAKYVGAATVEFLYDLDHKDYYFLEVNSRIQVEHPVTEVSMGVNIPAIQYLIGCGTSKENIIKVFNIKKNKKRHVIGIRITAEDALENFKPVTGDVFVDFVSSANTWGYFSVTNGTVHQFCDSQFGHIFSKGKTRDECIYEAIKSLKNLRIEKLQTPMLYLLHILNSFKFQQNEYNTNYIVNSYSEFLEKVYQEHPVEIYKSENKSKMIDDLRSFSLKEKHAHKYRLPHYLFFSVIHTLDTLGLFLDPKNIKKSISKLIKDGMRSNKLEYLYDNHVYTSKVCFLSNDELFININDSFQVLKFTILSKNRVLITSNGSFIFQFEKKDSNYEILYENRIFKFDLDFKGNSIKSPMRGKIIRYFKNDDDNIFKGEKYVEIELMKMRIQLESPFSGKFKKERTINSFIVEGEEIAKIVKNENEFYESFKGKIGKNILEWSDTKIFKSIFSGFNIPKYLWKLPDSIQEKITVLHLFNKNMDDNLIEYIEMVVDSLLIEMKLAEINITLLIICIDEIILKLCFNKNTSLKNKLLSFKNLIIELKFKEISVSLCNMIREETSALFFNQNIEMSHCMSFNDKACLGNVKSNTFYQRESFKKRTTCLSKDIILYSLKFMNELERCEAIKVYLKNILEEQSIEILFYDSKQIKFKGKGTQGRFIFEYNNEVIENEELIFLYNLEKQEHNNYKNFILIKVNDKEPFIEYMFADINSYSMGDPLTLKKLHIEKMEGYEHKIIYKCPFRNNLIFLGKRNNEERLFIRFLIDSYSGNIISDSNNFSHAINQILSSIKIYNDKFMTNNNHLYIKLSKCVKINDEDINRLVDDFVFFYLQKFLRVNVLEAEVSLNIDGDELLFCFSYLKGFLERRVFKNQKMCKFMINSHIIENFETENLICKPYNLEKIQKLRNHAIMKNTIYFKDFLELFKIYFADLKEKIKICEFFLNINYLVEKDDAKIFDKNPLKDYIILNNYKYQMTHQKKGNSKEIGIRVYKIDYKLGSFVVIMNDITHQNGSFSIEEDIFFFLSSKFCRKNKIPRIYIASNSGVRIGVYEQLKKDVKIELEDDKNSIKNLNIENFEEYKDSLLLKKIDKRKYQIVSIYGNKDSGPENLSFSGLIASETTKAYHKIFTLSYVSGMSVGIGAYLVRLGQRVIQKDNSPILLTGFRALNKLLQADLYKSNNQIGGTEVLSSNGISHLVVKDDYEGVIEIIRWIKFYYSSRKLLNLKNEGTKDKLNLLNEQNFYLSKWCNEDAFNENYNEREIIDLMFDSGRFKEYLANWAPNVIVGRGNINGISLGLICTESESITKNIPVEPNCEHTKKTWTKNVLFTESASKIYQSIEDFNHEGLDLLIIVNWKGFSGGTTDMFNGVLKEGSNIVNSLSKFKQKVLIYLPPNSQLRGGTWVVFDKKINPRIKIAAHPKCEVGVLQPDGLSEIKLKKEEKLEILKRNSIAPNEKILYEFGEYFCKLHDHPFRMKKNNLIDDFVSVKDLKKYILENIYRISE